VGLLGVCAVVLGSPRVVEAAGTAGVVANPPVTVMPSPDPWLYTIPLQFVPLDSPGPPTVMEYFTSGDYFTVTGFGNLIGINSLSLTQFQLDFADLTATTLRFNYTGPAYTGTSGGLFTTLDIGTVVIDTDTLSSSLSIHYVDHELVGGVPTTHMGTNPAPVTVVPEPSSIALLTLGTVGGLYFRRRAARRNA
jgi:hypothetical protein